MTVPAHWIKPNEANRVPRCFIYLDTEAVRERTPTGERQTWRLAVTGHDHQHDKNRPAKPTEYATHQTAGDLWVWVTARCLPKARCVLVAHNLAYDLQISEAFTILPTLGWRLVDVRLDRGQAFAKWSHHGRSLVMCDSLSWVNVSLDRLGSMVGIRKPELPADDAAADVWERRCLADVLILRDVWLRLVRFVESEDLGNWKPTGAGQAWSAWRHRFYRSKILVHDDVEQRVRERESCYTGRAEAWRHGRQRGGPWHEWDMSAAYVRVCQECELPVKLIGEKRRVTLDKVLRTSSTLRWLCEVTVTTEVPCVPTRIDGRIVWPVGTFDAVLWDNEISLAVDEGATVVLRRSWVYLARPALYAWADWVASILDAPAGVHDPVIVAAVKHWGRALVGRFGSRYTTWETFGDNPTGECGVGRVTDLTSGERWRLLSVGNRTMRSTAMTDGADSCPQVLSYVMAECRVRLWRAMRAAGFDHVVHVDTDGLIVDKAGHANLRRAKITHLRVKATFTSCEVLGPRQLVLGGKGRISGVPSSSGRSGRQSWAGEVWRTLAGSMTAGDSGAVVITRRTFQVPGVDHRRQHLQGGATLPIRVEYAKRPPRVAVAAGERRKGVSGRSTARTARAS